MPVDLDTTPLTDQYAARVADDLARIDAEIAELHHRIAVLDTDRAVLVRIQQTLGAESAGPATAQEPAAEPVAEPASEPVAEDAPAEAVVSVPRARRATKPRTRAQAPAKPDKTVKPARTAKSEKAEKAEKTAKPAKAVKSAKPAKQTPVATLPQLVAAHLAADAEPRSALEITAGLTAAHPDRNVNGPQVRNALEALVSRGAATRNKQGKSVYYTAPEAAATPAAAPAAEPVPAAAS